MADAPAWPELRHVLACAAAPESHRRPKAPAPKEGSVTCATQGKRSAAAHADAPGAGVARPETSHEVFLMLRHLTTMHLPSMLMYRTAVPRRCFGSEDTPGASHA